MFKSRGKVTIIAEGSKIIGNVSAEGLIELNGVVEGDLHCTSLHISKKGRVNGKIFADDVGVNGTIEGPVNGAHVHLHSSGRIIGDIQYDTLIVDQGGYFAGRSIQKEKTEKGKSTKQPASKGLTIKPRKASTHKAATDPKMANSDKAKLA